MKLLVLGAAGKTGREVVKQALAAGHDVRAFVRDAEKLELRQNLEVFIGDAEKSDDVTRAASDREAVISVLGHTNLTHSQPLTAAMTTLAEVLPPRARLISLTGSGVPDPNDPATPLSGKLLNRAVKLVPGDMFGDGLRHVGVLRASQLGWTVIRAAILTNGPAAGYELGYFKLTPRDAVSRVDVATAMVEALTDPTWLGQAPMIRPGR